MTVPDDGWQELPKMVMLSFVFPFGRLTVGARSGARPGNVPQAAQHNRKERP
jgi:hypothetical protein